MLEIRRKERYKFMKNMKVILEVLRSYLPKSSTNNKAAGTFESIGLGI